MPADQVQVTNDVYLGHGWTWNNTFVHNLHDSHVILCTFISLFPVKSISGALFVSMLHAKVSASNKIKDLGKHNAI